MPEPIKRYQEFVDKIYDSNAKLDWRPESWLGERAESVTGPKYTKEDARIFRSHVPEYKKIEKEARKNGTWLQMSDGTIWTGDPREWVIMQSEAFKKNYQENPWYTGQAEWATKVTLPDGTTVDTDKVKRARYHNGEMWFSNDAGYAQYFADAVGEGGVGRRNENYETSDVRGKVFLSAIPKKGNYRYLHNDSKGDLWWDMPYELTDNDIVRSKKIGKSKNDKWVIKSEGLNLKTDDIVNHSKKLGDDGIFMFNVMDGPVRRNIGNLPYYAVPNTGINEEMDPEGPSNSMHLEIPVNEFISQPGFTEKIKFIRGNNGNFDPNTDDKYSAIFKIDSPLFVKKGGRIHIKKKNRGKFTEYCGGKVTEECIAKGKKSKDPKIRKRATFAANARKWKHAAGGPLGKPNFKESREAYYDPETDTVFAPDSLGEFYHHEMFHARPNLQLLESLKPYYHNLNDDVLKQMGADLSFVKRFNNDPGYFYSPEELGARVVSASEMLNRMGVKDVTLDFLKNTRLNENAYGDNFRDLLHMYNDENLIKIFNSVRKHENGGILKAQNGTGNLLIPHPLSPVGIALNQARAMAKMKGEQHLPPGVKEVVGPDGKKVAIRTEQPLVPLEQSIAEWLPGTGDVAEVGYIANDVKNGNLGSAALAAAMVALPGNVGKVFRKSDVPVSKLTEAERLGIPKGERNQPLNGHLKGDAAVQMFKEYGTQFPEDMVRLYRASGTSGNFKPSLDGTAKYSGMWFTDNPRKVNRYASSTFKTAKRNGVDNPIVLEYIDIPKSQLDQFRAKNIIKGNDVEFEPTEDFLIPIDHTGRKQVSWTGFTGNYLSDMRIPHPELPLISKNSKIYSQIQQLVPEARERYKLVGRTDITDDEIAGSLYKRAMELNGNGNAAVWTETGEPRLLFRGDTRRYNRLMDKWSPEKLAKGEGTMDNSLGNLFLGDISGKGQGVDRYFISGTDFWEPVMQGSSTGARGKFGTIFANGGEGIQGTNIPYIPKDAYKLSTYQTYHGPYSLYKFPGKYSESGISDLNAFITRTPAMRDATGEISVLADDIVMKTKNYRGPNIDDYDGPTYDGVNSTVRDAMAKHYQSVLDDAQSKGQGLLFSEGLTDEYVKKFGEIHPFRREHEWYDYYALPNFNRQNAKHLFGWDLRKPVQWDVDNIYLEKGGILKAQEGTGNKFWSKLWNAVKEGGMAARDAKLGAVGAQQVRDLYSEGKNQEAQDLAKQYAKANTTGIALAGGAASTGLLGDLMVTGATTAADTFIDGDTENFGKNLSLNAAFDLVGHGVGKLLRNVDWGKVRNSVELIPDNTKANVSEYINTVDDALSERQPLTTNKSKQFWTGTSESKLTDAEKAGISKGERNQKITTQSQNQEYVKKYLDATTTPKEHTFDINHETIFGNLIDVDAFNTNLQDFIKTLPDSDSKFFIDKNIVDGYRNYLDHLDFDASAISDTDLQKFLSHYSETLSNSATGKLKDQLLFHSSPDWFERFDLSHTGKNTENTGVLGPGNYFSKEGDVYGRLFINDGRKQYHYMNNTQPYIITDIKSTPSGYDMQSKGLLPQIIHKYRMRTKGPTGGIFSDPDPSFDLKLKQLIDNTPVNDNKAYIIPSTSDARPALYKINGVFDGGEVMIRRNTGIKSIYPHPSRFVRTADGVVTLKPVDWSDARVNFKQGGKL